MVCLQASNPWNPGPVLVQINSMAILHNRVSQKELKERLFNETEPRITISFYRYFSIPDPDAFRDDLYKIFNSFKVFGRIYVAQEGVNAQVSVPESLFEAWKRYLESTPHFKEIRLNIAVSDGKSFWVLKIKVREKIVADGINDIGFNMMNKGKYLDAYSFNKMTEDANTLVIDMRNHYEYEVGHFNTAIEIPSDTFREQLPMAADMMKENKDKNIIMYCTGGIRCEKASAYMLYRGFKNVFALEGGIIHYTNTAKEKGLPNKFIGKNFVFDERLGERISEDIIAHCHQCGKPADTHVNCINEACHLLFIQCAECKQKYEGACSPACQQAMHLPAEERKNQRKGLQNGRMVFNKSKDRMNSLIHYSNR